MKALRIIYFSLEEDALEAFVAHLGVDSAAYADRVLSVELDGVVLELVHEMDVSRVRERLGREYVSFVLIELLPNGSRHSFDERRRAVENLIAELDHADDVELRYGFHRIGLLICGEDSKALEPWLLTLGAHGIRLAWRARSGEEGFFRRVLAGVSEAIRHRRVGKKALCLCGGGTTGIFFELGVLKCLQDCLPEGALNEMDLYFGISAGAVVSSLLAVGYSTDEIMAAIAGDPGTRMPAVDLKLVQSPSYILGLARKRILRAFSTSARAVGALWGRRRADSDVLASEYRGLWAPPFTTAALELYLRENFERPGATNQFDQLDRELYIGATDLDSRHHTLFGSKDAPKTTISKAVQASASFNPVFSPVKIGDRFFEDGAVTRTSNMSEAIERGATLVLIVDPFLPHVASQPGAHVDRSLFYHVDQNVRTMSFTRFANARKWVLRRHPEVGVYSFIPSNRQRHLLADNPMDHRSYAQIWRGAYLSTLARLERCWPKLSGDLSAHGLELNLDVARRVARHLEQTDEPTLRDFYPQRRLTCQQPALTLRRRRAAS